MILKRINVPDVDKIMREIDTINMQAKTIEGLQEQIKSLEQKSEILANQINQKSFELSKSQFDAKFTKVLSEIKNGENSGNG